MTHIRGALSMEEMSSQEVAVTLRRLIQRCGSVGIQVVVVDTAAVLQRVSILPPHGNDPYGMQIKHFYVMRSFPMKLHACNQNSTSRQAESSKLKTIRLFLSNSYICLCKSLLMIITRYLETSRLIVCPRCTSRYCSVAKTRFLCILLTQHSP